MDIEICDWCGGYTGDEQMAMLLAKDYGYECECCEECEYHRDDCICEEENGASK